MLYLVTGTPGSGKTLNTIKFINEDSRFQFIGHGDDKKHRQIYYHGIKNLREEFGWIELTDEQATNWFDLPPGSVIVFDEAYTIFPIRHGSKAPPNHVEKLATHRHHGYDIVMICQKVTGQLDPFIRGLVGQHRHYARILGSKNLNCYVWDLCQENPNSSTQKQLANVKPVRLDKKYYGVYHSADEHTHKLNLPWMNIMWLALTMTILGIAIYFVYDRFFSDNQNESVVSAQAGVSEFSSGSSTSPGANQHREISESFVYQFTPEVPDIPWSAPIYSDQIQAKTWPRPAACVHGLETDRVVCYSQQGTKMDIPRSMALRIIKEGFFDWTKEETVRDGAGGWGEESAAIIPPAPRTVSTSRVKIIPHKPQPRMIVEGRDSRPAYNDTIHGSPGTETLTPAQRQFF